MPHLADLTISHEKKTQLLPVEMTNQVNSPLSAWRQAQLFIYLFSTNLI
jgi:hypothetical protein